MLGEGYVPHPLNDTMLCRSASTPVNDLSTSPVARVLDKLYYHTFTRSCLYLTHSPPKKEKLALLDASIGLFICKEVRALYGT